MIEMIYFGSSAWGHIAAQVESVARDVAKAHKLRYTYVDVDLDKDTTLRHSVTMLPTIVLLRDGCPRLRLVGEQSKAEITAAVRTVKAGTPPAA